MNDEDEGPEGWLDLAARLFVLALMIVWGVLYFLALTNGALTADRTSPGDRDREDRAARAP